MAENYYRYTENNSIISVDTSTLLQDVQNEWISVFGESLSLDPSTPQGRIIEMEVANRKSTLELCALMANQINPYYSTGQGLDAIGALFGKKRKFATQTIVLCYLTGTPNSVIPADSQAKTSAGDIFYTPNNITLDSTGNASAYFYSVEKGAIPCEIETLTEIVTQVVGWNTINNPSSAIIGQPKENDTVFRERILASRYSGVALQDAIKGKLNGIDGVLGFAFYNNYEDTAVTWGDVVSVPAHSICVIIQGGDDEEIATALFDTVSIGCGYTAISGLSTTVNVPYKAGFFTLQYPITFNRPEIVNIICKVQISENNYTGSNIQQDIKNALLNWANNQVDNVEGLQIGSTIFTYEIGAALSQQMPEIIVRNVQIAEENGTLSNNPITLDITQLGSLIADNITVEVI